MTLATPDPIVTALVAFESRLMERIDTRFEQFASTLKQEFAGLLDAIIRRLDRLEVEYEMVKAGMARIEADVAVLKSAYGDLTAAFEDQRRAFEDHRIAFEDHRSAFARLEADVALVKAAVTRLEEGQAEDRADRRRLHDEVGAVRRRVDDLEARVRELETRIATR